MANDKKILKTGTPVKITREMGVDEEGCPKFPAGTQGLIVDQYELAPGIYEEDTYVVVIEGAGGVLMLAEGVEFEVVKKWETMGVLPADIKVGDRMETERWYGDLFEVKRIVHVTERDFELYRFIGDRVADGKYCERTVKPDFKPLVEREVSW